MRKKIANIFNVYVCLCDNVSPVFFMRGELLFQFKLFVSMCIEIDSLDHLNRVAKKV